MRHSTLCIYIGLTLKKDMNLFTFSILYIYISWCYKMKSKICLTCRQGPSSHTTLLLETGPCHRAYAVSNYCSQTPITGQIIGNRFNVRRVHSGFTKTFQRNSKSQLCLLGNDMYNPFSHVFITNSKAIAFYLSIHPSIIMLDSKSQRTDTVPWTMFCFPLTALLSGDASWIVDCWSSKLGHVMNLSNRP